jgi:hypothetical protein
VSTEKSLDRREAELAARERHLDWAIGEIKAVLAVLEHGKRFPVADAADGLTPRSRERLQARAFQEGRVPRQ